MQCRKGSVLLTPLDGIRGWTQLRLLCKPLRFWWAGLEMRFCGRQCKFRGLLLNLPPTNLEQPDHQEEGGRAIGSWQATHRVWQLLCWKNKLWAKFLCQGIAWTLCNVYGRLAMTNLGGSINVSLSTWIKSLLWKVWISSRLLCSAYLREKYWTNFCLLRTTQVAENESLFAIIVDPVSGRNGVGSLLMDPWLTGVSLYTRYPQRMGAVTQ